MNLLLLHPGAMGASVGFSLRSAGNRVSWVSAGRSSATWTRADRAGITMAATLEEGLATADGVICVCPPHAAVEVAGLVCGAGFDGAYVDANAVSPATAAEIASGVVSGGARYVDGSIVGPPAWKPGTTRLYLAGQDATAVASWFVGGPLEAISLPDADPTGASALKMAYAAWSKGSAALLLAVRALARANGVEAALLGEWERSTVRRGGEDLRARSEQAARSAAPRSWRFAGEMEEIAGTFAEAGLADGFHRAAADVYRRLEGFKGAESVDPARVIDALGDSLPSPVSPTRAGRRGRDT